LNVQTETLEQHIARLTVEVDLQDLEQAKQKAAAKISLQVNIPGFRRGKAPYRLIVNYVGEAAILEEAVETLGQDVYKKALEEAKIEPYTFGELENFQLEPKPTFIFRVPMEPTFDIKDYLSVRAEFLPKTVTDADLEKAMLELQESEAVVEPAPEPARMGNRITADVHGFYVDEKSDNDADDEEDEVEDAHDHDHAEDDDHDHDDEEDDEDFHAAPVHEHGANFYLDVEREEAPGFAEKLVGATPGERRVFEFTYPEDEEKYGEVSGRTIRFVLDVSAVDVVTLHPMNDELAARVTAEEEQPLTLLELRARVRQNLQTSAEAEYRAEYADAVLEKLVEGGEFGYPDAMVKTQIESMIERSASRFGVAKADYLRLIQRDEASFVSDPQYREAAEAAIKRSLAMRAIIEREQLTVTEAEISAEMDEFMQVFGGFSNYRNLLKNPEMRETFINNILEQKVKDRLVAIGRGEATPAALEPAISVTDESVSSEETNEASVSSEETNAAEA
jgi:trigger factor